VSGHCMQKRRFPEQLPHLSFVGSPGRRLLRVAELLLEAATISGDPALAAVSAIAIHKTMFASVCRSFGVDAPADAGEGMWSTNHGPPALPQGFRVSTLNPTSHSLPGNARLVCHHLPNRGDRRLA
jgi:hypothetical protein